MIISNPMILTADLGSTSEKNIHILAGLNSQFSHIFPQFFTSFHVFPHFPHSFQYFPPFSHHFPPSPGRCEAARSLGGGAHWALRRAGRQVPLSDAAARWKKDQLVDIDWCKGRIRGNSHISWENLWFYYGSTMVLLCFYYGSTMDYGSTMVLVGGDWNMTGLFFHSVGNVIIPIDSYFSEGLKPPTSGHLNHKD